MDITQMQKIMGSGQTQAPTQSNSSDFTPESMRRVMNIGSRLSPSSAAQVLGSSNNWMVNNPVTQSVIQPIQQQFQSGMSDITQGEQKQQTAQDPLSLIEGSAQMGSGAATALSAPLAPALSPISSAVNWLGDKMSNIPGIQKFAMSPAGEATSRMAQDVQYLSNIAGTVAGAEGSAPTVKAGTGAAGEALMESGAQSAAKTRSSFIKNLVTPEQTIPTKTAEIQAGRVKEGGIAFKGRQVELTPQMKSTVDTVNSIPGVKHSNTVLDNVNAVHDAIGKTASDLKSQLESSNITFPKQELMSFLKGAKNDLAQNPLITGDAEKTATKMLDKFSQLIEERPSTPSSLLDARKEFDQWIKSQKGDSVFDPARDNAISVALKTIRQGANNFLADKVPNVPVKQLLSKQTDMYNAIDAMAPKAAKEAETRLGRLVQKAGEAVGVKNKIVQEIGAAVGLAGFGAAAYFAPASAALGGLGGLGYGLYKGITAPSLRTGLGKTLKGISDIIPGEVPKGEGGGPSTPAMADTPKADTSIPKELEPLAAEARKYKSAEEFVRAQDKNTVYHATDQHFDNFNPSLNADDVGTWFAKNKADVTDPEVAKILPIIKEQVLNPGTKLITEAQLSKFEQSKLVLDSSKPIHELLMEKGYRGIKYENDTIQLFEPNVDTIPKSQLTDFYNKVKGTK